MTRPYYITTAIDYPNALPHIGTAFEKIGADVFARYCRSNNKDVFLLMGNDENTSKVLARTKQLGKEPSVYVDDMARQFKAIWDMLEINYDKFIQTSHKMHRVGVEKFIAGVHRAGYIYKNVYTALYCQGCEEIKTKSTLENGKCQAHPQQPLIELQEQNYFFALSRFKEALKGLYSSLYLQIEPKTRQNEILKLIDDIEDISISRENSEWGIRVPWDETQRIYVWFDALLSYLTGVGFGIDNEKFRKYWPARLHVVGKDITRFHGILLPAMILAYNEATDDKISTPRNIFSHGFIYEKKEKVSKSGNSISPVDLVNQYGSDAVRYFLMSQGNFADDVEYSLPSLHRTYTTDLVNGLGNLWSRTLTLISKAPAQNFKFEMEWLTIDQKVKYHNAMESLNFKVAIDIIRDLVARANRHIDANKPWEKKPGFENVLDEVAACLLITAGLIYPFMPKTSKLMSFQLGTLQIDNTTDFMLFPRIKL